MYRATNLQLTREARARRFKARENNVRSGMASGEADRYACFAIETQKKL